MTPRETTAVSSTTSAYSSCLVTPTATASTSSSPSSRSSSTCLERSLVEAVPLDPNATTPMPHHGGSSKRVAAEASPSTSLLAVQTKHAKKRRRIGVVCRTHSPTASPHNSPKTFKAVKRIPPTLPGVQKAAQVLHENGIVVFPTERTYEACVRWSPEPWECHVSPFFAVAFQSNARLQPTSIITTTTTSSSSSSSSSSTSSLPSSSGYHVYVPKQKLGQLDKLLGFPKKAYALKPPSTSSTSTTSPTLSPSSSTTFPTSTTTTTPTCQKIYYFSETRWILHRLAHRYWPGPVKIYVPVRASTALPCELLQPLPCSTPPSTTNQGILSHNSTTHTINAAATAAATATTTTDLSSSSCGKSPAVEQTTASHATPTNTTTTTTTTSAANHGTSESILHYLGLRCPSHPLTARILQEAVVCTSSPPDIVTNTNQQPQQHIPQPSTPHSWWLGLPVQGSSEASSSSFLTTAQEVAQQVLLRTCKLNQPGSTSPTPNSNGTPTAIAGAPTAMTVHVVNGEDKRELFAVPTCQHSSSISLWIDDTSRTIHVFGKESNSTVPFSVQQLERLLQEDDQEGFGFLRGGSFSTDSPILGPRPVPSLGDAPPNLEADGRQRVIRAVLRKWKVVHHAVEG